MNTLEVEVTGCDFIFNEAMELWDTLQEDPNLQRLSKEIKEAQQKYDKIRATMHTLAPVQEGKMLHAQLHELHQKELMLKAQIQTWTKEASQISQTIHEKLKALHQTHRTMQLAVEGPTTEKLVAEVKKVEVQSTTEMNTLKQQFNEFHHKVKKPSERLDGESPYLCWGLIGIWSLGSILV